MVGFFQVDSGIPRHRGKEVTKIKVDFMFLISDRLTTMEVVISSTKM